MNKKLTISALIAITLLSACSVKVNNKPVNSLINSLTARDAIELSEAAAPEGVSGIYSLLIKQHGTQTDVLYLNTQLDYRDRRNVSVVIPKNVQDQYFELHDQTIEKALLNKSIMVYGKAKRTQIWFYSQNKQTDKYYFQTHINVSDAKQIKLDW